MRKANPLPGLIFVFIFGIGLGCAYFESVASVTASAAISLVALLVAFVASYAVKIADQWEKTVVLRLGRFRSLEGPGDRKSVV